MGTKYQDSTPQRQIWSVGQPTNILAWNTWGYDSALVTFKPLEGKLTGGTVIFEGFLGFAPDKAEAWGDWFDLQAEEVNSGEMVNGHDASGVATAYWVKIIGFSQFRARLDEPLQGEGSIQVGVACHAGV